MLFAVDNFLLRRDAPTSGGTLPFVLGFGKCRGSVVTADLLGSSTRVKPLDADEIGVRTIRDLNTNSAGARAIGKGLEPPHPRNPLGPRVLTLVRPSLTSN